MRCGETFEGGPATAVHIRRSGGSLTACGWRRRTARSRDPPEARGRNRVPDREEADRVLRDGRGRIISPILAGFVRRAGIADPERYRLAQIGRASWRERR